MSEGNSRPDYLQSQPVSAVLEYVALNTVLPVERTKISTRDLLDPKR